MFQILLRLKSKPLDLEDVLKDNSFVQEKKEKWSKDGLYLCEHNIDRKDEGYYMLRFNVCDFKGDDGKKQVEEFVELLKNRYKTLLY